MPVDAGSISSEVRIRLDKLSSDITSCKTAFDNLGTEFADKAEKYSTIAGKHYTNALKTVAKETKNVEAATKAGALSEREGVQRLLDLRRTELQVLQKRAIAEQGANQSTNAAIQKTQGSITALTEKQKLLAGETNKAAGAFQKLSGLAGTLGIGVSIAAAINYIKGAVVEFAKAEQAAQTLDRALELRGMQAAKSGLVELAESLQRVGVEDEDVTKQLEAGLVASGRSEDQIKALIVASAGLSSVTGDQLETSLEQLNKTLEGVTPRSAELKAVMGDLTEEELKNGKGIERVIENYAKFIGKTGETALALKQVKFALSDLTESIGGEISGGVKTATPIIVELANAFKTLIPKLSQGYKDFLQLKGVFAFLGPLLAPVSAAIAGFGGAFQVIAAVIRGDIPGAFNRMGKTALDVLDQLITPTASVINFAIGGINKISEGIAKLTGKKPALLPEFTFFGGLDAIDDAKAKLDVAYAEIQKNAGAAAAALTGSYNAAKSAAEKAAEAAQKLADLQKENADQAKSILEGQKSESQKYYDQIIELQKTPAANGALEKERQAAIKVLMQLMEQAAGKEVALANETALKGQAANKALAASTEDYANKLALLKGKISDTIEIERAKALATTRASGASADAIAEAEDAISAYYDALKESKSVEEFKKKQEELKKSLEAIGKATKDLFDAIMDAVENSIEKSAESSIAALEELYETEAKMAEDAYEAQRELDEEKYANDAQMLEDWYGLRQELIEYDGQTKLESLQEQLDAAIAAGDTETAAELKKQIDLINLKAEYDAKKKAMDDQAALEKEKKDKAYEDAKEARDKKLRYDSAMYEYDAALGTWKISIAKAIADAALSIVGIWGQWGKNPVIAGILTGVSAAATGVAIGTIASNKPQPPALATGGIVLPSSGGVPTILAENGYPELALNGGPSGRSFLKQFAREIAAEIGAGGSTQIVLNPQPIMLDGRIIAQSTADYFDNGQVKVKR